MSRKVVCSICSRSKREDADLLPAIERYTGSHIRAVEEISKEQGRPFFVLSGVYGIISSEELIPYYDHLFVKDEIPELLPKVMRQIKEANISSVDFYTKDKPNWEPYRHVLSVAADNSGIPLNIILLEDDD